MRYVKLSIGQQSAILRQFKDQHSLTWNEIGEELGVTEGMIYKYLNETSKIPLSAYRILTGNQDVETVVHGTDIIRPLLSRKLAEFTGVLAGDGHLGRRGYEVSVTLNLKTDLAYANYISRCFNLLFNVQPTMQKQPEYSKVKCYVYSSQLHTFLRTTFKHPVGKKKGHLHVPHLLHQKPGFLQPYIRGLFDTDGTIHRHHSTTAMIGIISKDDRFLREVKDVLAYLGYTTSKNGKNLYIYDQDEIHRFFNTIQPANEKHTTKYRAYRRTGTVPTTDSFK